MGIQEDYQGQWNYSVLIIMQLWEKLWKAISMSHTFYLNQVFLSYSLSPPNGLHFLTAQPHGNVLGLLEYGYGRQKPVCRALGEKGKQKT